MCRLRQCKTIRTLHQYLSPSGHLSGQGSPWKLEHIKISFGSVKLLTVEECIQVVVVNLAKFEEVFAYLGAQFNFEVDDDVTERCLKQDRHCTALIRVFLVDWFLDEIFKLSVAYPAVRIGLPTLPCWGVDDELAMPRLQRGNIMGTHVDSLSALVLQRTRQTPRYLNFVLVSTLTILQSESSW